MSFIILVQEHLPSKRFSKLIKQFFSEKKYFLPCFLALLNAIATYFFIALDIEDNLSDAQQYYKIVLFSNIFFIAILFYLIVSNILHLRQRTKKHPEGSKFRYKLVVVFSLAAFVPALMMAIFSVVTFKKATDSWFNISVEKAINNANLVSKAYIHEHEYNIKGDVFACYSDIVHLLKTPETASDTVSFGVLIEQLRVQLLLRNLGQIVIYAHTGQVLAFVQNKNFQDKTTPTPIEQKDIRSLKKNIAISKLAKNDEYIYALLPAQIGNRHYILRIDRKVDPFAIQFQTQTKQAVHTYNDLKGKKRIAEFGFALIYISFALVIITFMVYAGMYFASDMTMPLEALTRTVNLLQSGQDHARMPVPTKSQDEIDRLILAFNRMADNLVEQKQDLIRVNKNLDARRLLNEEVLSSVFSGVVGLDNESNILLMNIRAENIFGLKKKVITLMDISQEFYDAVAHHRKQESNVLEFDYTHTPPKGRSKYLHIRLSKSHNISVGFAQKINLVLTVDDITEQVKAQSMAAWRDVARRIAHEIKNPLTPISLSVERIKRKWGKDITFDKEIFDECLDVIARQVDHIRETTDSFAAFAKMPEAVKKIIDLRNVLEESLFLEQLRCANILYEYHQDINDSFYHGDARLLSQAFINILKNASEAITQTGADGTIEVFLHEDERHIFIDFVDNGGGLPENIPSYRLFDPYVTGKEEGTGLGLAITAKIIHAHNGKISLNPQEGEIRGTLVKIAFLKEFDKG